MASPLGGLTSPIVGGLTSLTVTLIGLPLGSSLPALDGLTSFIVTLGGLISLMTDLTSMVILLGSSTSIAKIALYRRSTLFHQSSCEHHSSPSIFTHSNTLDCIRMSHCTKLGWVGIRVCASKWPPTPSHPPATRRPTEFKAGVRMASEREGFRETPLGPPKALLPGVYAAASSSFGGP